MDPVHIISSASVFDPEKELQAWMQKVNCKKFSVVAILGAQSSGKSTLLNKLFGTRYAVMEASKGRYTCTEGIWLAKAQHTDVLIMDVEGTDSAKRGEAHAEFESKVYRHHKSSTMTHSCCQTTLFSLALSDIVIFNIHEKDIGLYNASSYTLLRTVFEQHIRLFHSDPCDSTPVKTLILVVIRNYERETAAESHASDLLMQFNSVS